MLKKATQVLPDAQDCQGCARAGSNVDLDGVGHVQGVPSNGSKNSCFINFAKKATQALADAQVCQRWVIAGSHVDLDGVGQVQSVPSNSINNSCLVNVTQ